MYMYTYIYIYIFSLYTHVDIHYDWMESDLVFFLGHASPIFFGRFGLLRALESLCSFSFWPWHQRFEMLMRCHKQIVWKDNGMQQQFDEFAIVGNFLHLSWARFDRFATACQTLFLVIVMGCTLYSNTWVPRIGNSGVRVIILLPNWMAMRSKLEYENI